MKCFFLTDATCGCYSVMSWPFPHWQCVFKNVRTKTLSPHGDGAFLSMRVVAAKCQVFFLADATCGCTRTSSCHEIMDVSEAVSTVAMI